VIIFTTGKHFGLVDTEYEEAGVEFNSRESGRFGILSSTTIHGTSFHCLSIAAGMCAMQLMIWNDGNLIHPYRAHSSPSTLK
jgi:hypothetical protein